MMTVYKFERIVFNTDFTEIVTSYKQIIGYNINVLRQTACIVVKQLWLLILRPSLFARQ